MMKLQLQFRIIDLKDKAMVKDTLSRIIKECFWDYDFSAEDIERIVRKGSYKEKMFLFQKILANSTNILKDLRIFSKEELKELFKNYRVPQFNREFLQNRKGIAEYVFFDKPFDIPGLSWGYGISKV